MTRNRKIELATIIGKGTTIEGTVKVEGGIRIDGYIQGQIISDGFVTIGLSGEAKADIKAKECLISGRVTGNIQVADALELDKSAQLQGDIVARVLTVEAGALFNGGSSMGTSNTVKKPALPKTDETPDTA
ncbi:MAG: polymer-forming cytoskeletal protein [Candidatus Cloacimonetes bacterium]|nr:polymer-forming cytoskeletal protein [Candidatus Cloacimonadota bacterium]